MIFTVTGRAVQFGAPSVSSLGSHTTKTLQSLIVTEVCRQSAQCLLTRHGVAAHMTRGLDGAPASMHVTWYSYSCMRKPHAYDCTAARSYVCVQVRSVRLNAWSKLHSVLQSAASPNLLVLTAQQQQQQAVPSAVLRSAASATTSDSGAGAGEPAGPHFTESQPLQRLKRLAIYPALNGVLLVDTLTLKQKATLIVASYPWCA